MRTGRRALLGAGAGAALLAGLGAAGVTWRDDRRADEVADAVDDDASARRGIQRTLDRRAAGVRGRDLNALTATVVPGSQALIDQQGTLLRNLAQVPLSGWDYRLRALDAFALPPTQVDGADRRAVRVQLAYRLTGFDATPVTADQYLGFTRIGSDWLLSGGPGESPGQSQSPGVAELWDLGPVNVVQGRHCLVLGLRGAAGLQPLADEADRAVPAVSAVWGDGWGQRTVLQVPLGLDQFGALLGADPLGFSAIAAVTTGELGAAEAGRTERITVNPQVWDGLNALGRRVVTTHETTHVATRAITEQWTPRWLSEGAANWTGYLGTGRTPAQIAPELAADLAAGRVPAQLPADSAFDGSAPGLPQAYQQAWFACRCVVQRHGQPALVALYRAVAAAGGRSGQDAATDTALRGTLGVGLTAFTAQWRADLLAALKPTS
ncbi:hypothetical protein [Streptacidiphilus sp. EB129]|uniref:hypothetical protein n=1 Tax=Streptacidiphilus sp. EB129 TaxID=3156262 RepID=UPI0035182C02